MRPLRKKRKTTDASSKPDDENSTTLSKEKENYLKTLYTDPSRPGSFSGINKLSEAIKNDGTFKFSRAEIKRVLAKEDTYTVNRFVRRKFQRSRVIAYGVNDLVDVDLADFTRLSRYNKNIKFLLVAIDVFSRFVKVRPLRDKTAGSVVSAFESLYAHGPLPRKVRTDLGAELRNSKLEHFFEKNGIRHIYASPPIKAGYAKRCIQSLKQLIYRYLYQSNSFRYIEALDKIVDSYNSRPHRSLGKLAPRDVNEKNQVSLWNRMYIDSLRSQKDAKKRNLKSTSRKTAQKFTLKKGQLVRISYAKSPFERSYNEKFTEESFTVKDHYLLNGVPVYKLADLQNCLVEGIFYSHDLQAIIKTDDLWQIERILKTKGKGKNQKVLVRWKGYGPKFDSYVLKSSLKNIGK